MPARWCCAVCLHVADMYARSGCALLVILLIRTALRCVLSLCCRLSLPEHLELDSLVVHCPGQAVYVGLDRVMAKCTRVQVTAERINMLLHVSTLPLHVLLGRSGG